MAIFIMMRMFSIVLMLICVLWSGSSVARPNIVVVIVDDLGYGQLRLYGGTIAAPSIEALAQEGVAMTNFHAQPMCTPSRDAFLTGRYPQKNGLTWALGAGTTRGLPASDITLAERFVAAGYKTALIGKWHLGELVQFSPTRHGFQYFFGMKGGEADHFSHRNKLGQVDWWRGETRLTPTGKYSATEVTAEAVQFIRNAASSSFFLVVAYQEPHVPVQGPQDAAGVTVPGHYPDMVWAVDAGVGSIRTELYNRGIANNTIILFMSDHGGINNQYGGNAPLRGLKESLYEGGIRVRAIAWWPRRFPHRFANGLMAVQDWYPTLSRLAGIPLPTGYKIDGIDLSGLLFGTSGVGVRQLFWLTPSGIGAALESPWKLLNNNGVRELYNLSSDLGERINVASSQPVIATRLNNALNIWKTNGYNNR